MIMKKNSIMDCMREILLLSNQLQLPKSKKGSIPVQKRGVVNYRPIVDNMIVKLNEGLNRKQLVSMGRYSKYGDFNSDEYLASLSNEDIPSEFNERRFIDTDVLEFNFHLGKYTITLEFYNIVDCYKKQFKGNGSYNYKLRCVNLNKAIDLADIKINCTCSDFTRKLAYNASRKGFKAGDIIKNSSDDSVKGSGCKHIMKILNSKTWLKKYITVILHDIEDKVDLFDNVDDTEKENDKTTKTSKSSPKVLKSGTFLRLRKRQDISESLNRVCNSSRQLARDLSSHAELLERAFLYKKNYGLF